jgi:putative transcriptional regulator
MGVYDSIIRGLDEAIEYERGNLKNVRTRTVTVTPLPLYKAPDIKKIRVRLKLSQPLFGNIIGVSPKTVEAWECGRNKPNGPSLRMIEMLDKEGQDMVKRYIKAQ